MRRLGCDMSKCVEKKWRYTSTIAAIGIRLRLRLEVRGLLVDIGASSLRIFFSSKRIYLQCVLRPIPPIQLEVVDGGIQDQYEHLTCTSNHLFPSKYTHGHHSSPIGYQSLPSVCLPAIVALLHELSYTASSPLRVEWAPRRGDGICSGWLET